MKNYTGGVKGVRSYDAIQRMPNGSEKDAALRELGREHFSPERISIGKFGTNQRASLLSDAQGKPGIRMSVEEPGNPKLEFLDDTGKVTFAG